ncbi:hypothetical protein C8A00DRAFT_45904 [Chaetomidium leptoderma]|uniref:Rhodopsin domain-containing protein n=1 Tax=Chaetomidium leptoderma TaxID=669021 RepID=A0AAN6ZUN9_9PEZI|nr:hypothetical protein C8A00DRAFT_45904 [Chaetomidium leptoderma]
MSSDSSTDNRGGQLAAINIAALVLATSVTALRCFVRIRLLRAFGLDDWLMVAAAASFAFYCSCSLAGITSGTGQHVADLSREANAEARKWWWFCYPSYAFTMMLTKMSITFFFRRVIVDRLHKWILIATAAITIISCTIFFFACIFQCWPVSYFWDKYSQTGTCIPDSVIIALAFLFSAINIITDFTFALMPAWVLSHLNMKLKTKVALCILMGLGCIASAAVVVRLPYMRLIASDDFLYDTVDVAIWSTVEQALAITAGGLATLQPLIKLIAYKLGLRSRPTLPTGYGDNIRMNGGSIAVKRSFTHRSELLMPGTDAQYGQMGLNLQPVAGEYSAVCYNTSQELLRLPTGETERKSSKDLERGGTAKGEESEKMPAAYLPNRK